MRVNNQKQKSKYFSRGPAILFAVFLFSFAEYPAASLFGKTSAVLGANTTILQNINKEIHDLNEEINKKKSASDDLENQKKAYEQKLKVEQNKIITLKEELTLLDDKIQETELAIEIKEMEIKKMNLEIQQLEAEILDKDKVINQQKEQIAEFLRFIYQYDQQNYLSILLLNDSVSEFFNQIKYAEDLQQSLREILADTQDAKESLKLEQESLESKKKELSDLTDSLNEESAQLEIKKTIKTVLLKQTKGKEREFQNLIAEAKRELNDTNAEITKLEEETRKKMAEKLAREKEMREGSGPPFSWPTPNNKITTYFHDPDYPYRRWLGEHPAIDIRATQGTTVYAAASGYVAKVKNGGSRGYSYVLIVHSDGFSTVYGHLSKISIKEDTYVSRGQIIGLSGGMPGTSGAGPFSSGPHLHFEVRLNSEPVNPLKYLL